MTKPIYLEEFVVTERLTFLAVHAHPDDEASSTGGLFPLLAEQAFERCWSLAPMVSAAMTPTGISRSTTITMAMPSRPCAVSN